jgi:membrane-bound serine protease (ClpP class)
MLTGHSALALTGTVLLAAALYMAAAGQPYHQTQAAAYAAAGILATAAVALAYLGYKVRQALRRRPQDYTSQLIGAVGVAKTPISPGKPGVVYAAGEEWTAEADEEIPQGAKVIITAIEGLTLKVKKTPIAQLTIHPDALTSALPRRNTPKHRKDPHPSLDPATSTC